MVYTDNDLKLVSQKLKVANAKKVVWLRHNFPASPKARQGGFFAGAPPLHPMRINLSKIIFLTAL